MLGFSSIAASPFAAIKFSVVEAVSLSEGMSSDSNFYVTGASFVSVAETVNSSETVSVSSTFVSYLQEETQLQSSESTQTSFNVLAAESGFVFHYSDVNTDSIVSVAENIDAQAITAVTTNSNVTMQENINVEDLPSRRLLWELVNDAQVSNWGVVNDAQTPNWQDINTV